jgi:hypothetical protein
MRDDKKYLVVTPSVRDFPYKYFEPLQEKVDHIIIDDSRGKVDRSAYADRTIIATDEFIKEYLGVKRRPTLIPSGNPSCKNFGLLYAWRQRYDVVILLDDDVDLRVHNQDFAKHVTIGEKVRAKSFTSESGWYNPMVQLMGKETNLFSRGYPYEFRQEKIKFLSTDMEVEPALNAGLWYRVPDINGVDKMHMAPDYIGSITSKGLDDFGKPWFVPEIKQCSPSSVIVRDGQYLPLSIMNVQLDRKLIPAFWQPPDYTLAWNFKIRRHDDIWSMSFLKKAMEHFRDVVTVGLPMVSHMKFGNPINEVVNEHCSNLIQPWVVATIRAAANSMRGNYGSYAEYAIDLADRMQHSVFMVGTPGVWREIIQDYARNAGEWARLFL